MEGQCKTKNIGIELLRIVCMFMIIILHLLYKGNILHGAEVPKGIAAQAWLLEAFCYVSVNCYIMISGWVLVGKEERTKGRIGSIWFKTFFYSALIGTICFFVLPEVKRMTLVQSWLPVISNSYWFVTNYLILYILFPYINKLLAVLDKKQFQKLLVFSVLIFSIWPNVFPFFETVDESRGYSIVWFILMYMTGAYLKLYGAECKKKYLYIAGYLGCSLFTFASLLVLGYLGEKISFFKYYTYSFYAYNSISVFGASVCLFMAFLKVGQAVHEKNKFSAGILFFSGVTFDVYLIHEQVILRDYLWTKLIPVDKLANIGLFIPAVLLITLVVFILCCFIGKIYEYCFKIIRERF